MAAPETRGSMLTISQYIRHTSSRRRMAFLQLELIIQSINQQ
ncbi:hypothetical protein BN1221_01743c [Brenneria goodwinii]|uniref:Uncharacterized protein n=1 Tax=Brenneria goodwinii TaxID=1109412 RepID=A0A0G4JTN8_9GAMM|nr:hypothetical protein BN1221_01743c [Brenneria goodwinii]